MTAYNKSLLLAPHTDDGEFGCGGTLAKLIEQGLEVHYAAFSVCEQSVPRHLPQDILASELKTACRTLGILEEHIHVFRYPVRQFPEFRQQILDDLIELKRNIGPDLILLPSQFDTHQDHQVMAQEGFRAFKDATLLGYEMPWNNLSFTTSCFSILAQRHLDKKIAAMEAYGSQRIRPYADAEFLTALARTRGIQIKETYAEAFEVLRLIV